jgi:predicted ATPase
MVMWCLGYPDAALRDADQALQDARKLGQAATLMVALSCSTRPYFLCGDYASAGPVLDELVALADEKGAAWWKAFGTLLRGEVFGETGNASVAAQTITSGFAAQRSTGARFMIARFSSCLARAYASLDRLDDAWRSIDEAVVAIETTKDKWWEAEVHRFAGEIALKSPEPDAAKAEAYFERALAVARQQQAKSWELRAAMSMARLWRDQGKVQQARELLAPVYGWFTEGFDTLDLKEANALLDALAS